MLVLWQVARFLDPEGRQIRVHLWQSQEEARPRIDAEIMIDGAWEPLEEQVAQD